MFQNHRVSNSRKLIFRGIIYQYNVMQLSNVGQDLLLKIYGG